LRTQPLEPITQISLQITDRPYVRAFSTMPMCIAGGRRRRSVACLVTNDATWAN
jgi:hypothetical protein